MAAVDPGSELRDKPGPWVDLGLTLPIFLVYHFGVIFLRVQNATDVVTGQIVRAAEGNRSMYLLITAAIGVVFAGVFAALGRGQAFRPAKFVQIAIEGFVYAVVMRVGAAYVVGRLLAAAEAAPGAGRMLAAGDAVGAGRALLGGTAGASSAAGAAGQAVRAGGHGVAQGAMHAAQHLPQIAPHLTEDAAHVAAKLAAVGVVAPAPDANPFVGFIMSLGAGFYEELAFRVLLFGLGAKLLVWMFAHQKYAVVAGTPKRLTWRALLVMVLWAFASAAIFSGVHYVGTLGDAFALSSFLFRLVLGLVLTAISRRAGSPPRCGPTRSTTSGSWSSRSSERRRVAGRTRARSRALGHALWACAGAASRGLRCRRSAKTSATTIPSDAATYGARGPIAPYTHPPNAGPNTRARLATD